ncbi:DbpA RNA binding domain-containing protein [Treponema sp. HNW]|uniref:DbpA RNA binding domain-containing protein n=1 Tax=Treponema sp. HNW TaxID=3116654 RepID=UPI003D0C7F00
MAFQRDNSGINERFEALLADAVVQVKTKEDPLVLNDYKKLFKKNVPLVLRSYVAAYLAKQIASGISFETGKHKNGRTPFSRHGRGGERTGFEGAKTAKKESSASPRISIEPESAAAVFISIGRNRGVFPRDLICLIIQRAGIERDRIGEIRVLDNYSFVQVYAEDADKIIEALNGTDYRNRKITVSHSRKKDEQDRACEEQSDKLYESSIHDEYDEQTEQSCRTEDGGELSRMP